MICDIDVGGIPLKLARRSGDGNISIIKKRGDFDYDLWVLTLKKGFNMISKCLKTFQRGMGNTTRLGYAKGF